MKIYLNPENTILNIPLKIKSYNLIHDKNMPERIEKVYNFLCKRYNVVLDGVRFGFDDTDIADCKTTMLLTFKIQKNSLIR